ncbi:MAG: hypothetical protein IJV72_08285 [Clostridia bacterium]|nr:hypothetical protein [Clostridia bacterium]
MSNFIYSKMSGKNDAMYGKFEHPIKMLIEAESNAQEKHKGIVDVLFNVEKSNRYAETIIGESDFDTFQHAKEGQGAENDSVEMTFKKTIEHIAFMKEFTITKEMADDAKSGISADIKSKPKKFVRAYYKTRNKLASWALINGTKTTGVFNKATVDLTTADGLSLFHSAHKYYKPEMKGTQSNYFYGDIASDSQKLEEALGVLANKLRNFKDENGEVMEYVADIIIVPCNRPKLEAMVKKVVGSERTVGSNNNDINTQYGNWTVVVLPGWETADDRLMIMSSEANENLYGNMFYNRVPLDIRSNIDDHTRNYYWNGYCRFGVGFNTWKHIALAVHSEGTVSGATKLA